MTVEIKIQKWDEPQKPQDMKLKCQTLDEMAIKIKTFQRMSGLIFLSPPAIGFRCGCVVKEKVEYNG